MLSGTGRFFKGYVGLGYDFGNFAIGAELLQAGARHVVLLDRFAPPDNRRNVQLPSAYPDYFHLL